MDVTTALRTNGAVRGFTSDPVSDAVVAELLDDARFAPSGGNQQPWRVAVVKSPDVRAEMASLMRPVWEEYMGAQRAGKRAFAFGKSTGDEPVAYDLGKAGRWSAALAVSEVAGMRGYRARLAGQPSFPAGSVQPGDQVFNRGTGEGWLDDGDV